MGVTSERVPGGAAQVRRPESIGFAFRDTPRASRLAALNEGKTTMSTKALRTTQNIRIVRRLREETCPVARIMREAAACWRLLKTDHAALRINKLHARDRSELTSQYIHTRLYRRLKGLETLASELQPT